MYLTEIQVTFTAVECAEKCHVVHEQANSGSRVTRGHVLKPVRARHTVHRHVDGHTHEYVHRTICCSQWSQVTVSSSLPLTTTTETIPEWRVGIPTRASWSQRNAHIRRACTRAHVMTVGASRPVSCWTCESSNPSSISGASASAVSIESAASSPGGTYFSI